mmetsp:Transcript_13862/g.42978  ORF Transcript_13862/g.42978 Transcript_13862/m.42978 type:complete len:225 (+) Transcript_13862:457-1131(+)
MENGAPTRSVGTGTTKSRQRDAAPRRRSPRSGKSDSAWRRTPPRSSKTSRRNLSFLRRDRAASTRPALAVAASTRTRKNAASEIFNEPVAATPALSGATPCNSASASSHAFESTSAATVVGMGTPSLDTCASRNRDAHDCDLTSTDSNAFVSAASRPSSPWRSYWRRLFGSLSTAYASDTSRNAAAAASWPSPRFRSGWYFSASFLYFFEMPCWSSSFAAPSTS